MAGSLETDGCIDVALNVLNEAVEPFDRLRAGFWNDWNWLRFSESL